MKQCEECEHPIYRSEVRYELVRGVGKIVCPDCANELRVLRMICFASAKS
jgi:formylmethanofuran dehydrogenase subunit E